MSSNASPNTSPNTFTTSSCKQCANTINNKASIYKGFDCIFCSNYCRSIFSKQIFKKDYNLLRHELWFL